MIKQLRIAALSLVSAFILFRLFLAPRWSISEIGADLLPRPKIGPATLQQDAMNRTLGVSKILLKEDLELTQGPCSSKRSLPLSCPLEWIERSLSWPRPMRQN